MGTQPTVARGVRDASVQGLSASTDYVCYVIASNPAVASPVCSDPLRILTGSVGNFPPGQPTNLQTYPIPGALTGTTWRATWNDVRPPAF